MQLADNIYIYAIIKLLVKKNYRYIIKEYNYNKNISVYHHSFTEIR